MDKEWLFEGKCSRHKGWWREGKDELATHSMTMEVWISIRGRISEATHIALQQALEEDCLSVSPYFAADGAARQTPDHHAAISIKITQTLRVNRMCIRMSVNIMFLLILWHGFESLKKQQCLQCRGAQHAGSPRAHLFTHMRFPSTPNLDHLSDYLNWQCIHVLSSRKYHDFVTEQSLLPDKVW